MFLQSLPAYAKFTFYLFTKYTCWVLPPWNILELHHMFGVFYVSHCSVLLQLWFTKRYHYFSATSDSFNVLHSPPDTTTFALVSSGRSLFVNFCSIHSEIPTGGGGVTAFTRWAKHHKQNDKACVFKLKSELELNSKFILQPILPQAFDESQQLLLALSSKPHSPVVLREPAVQTALKGILLYKLHTDSNSA